MQRVCSPNNVELAARFLKVLKERSGPSVKVKPVFWSDTSVEDPKQSDGMAPWASPSLRRDLMQSSFYSGGMANGPFLKPQGYSNQGAEEIESLHFWWHSHAYKWGLQQTNFFLSHCPQ